MAWLIVCFSDLTVSIVSEKWMRKNCKKCYFPKYKVAFHIKKETSVDKESGNWVMYSCRILMHGKKYATLKEAKKAERIAQNHSTMTSFENSYAANQEVRKHPKVYNDSSDADSIGGDFKNIDELRKLDSSVSASDKVYTYHRSENTGANESFEVESIDSAEGDCHQSFENDSVGADGFADEEDLNGSDDDMNGSDVEDDDINGSDDDMNGSDVEDDDINGSDDDMNGSDVEDDDINQNYLNENDEKNDDVNENNSTSSKDDSKTKSRPIESNEVCSGLYNIDYTPVESTNLVNEIIDSTNSDYNNFAGDRRLDRIEKQVMYACNELNLIKADLKEIKKTSNEANTIMKSLVPIFRDLSVEVFGCKEEIKKRNGMFTDLLVPDIQFPIKTTEQFHDVESALGEHKVVDNLIKYLGSNINESTENGFVKACINVIFEHTFFMEKVWWKREPGKVLIKNSQILHCIRESFKTKFGLVEPKKPDNAINKLIHEICVNLKDSRRKSTKKKKDTNIRKDRKSYANVEEGLKTKNDTKKAVQLEKAKKIGEEADEDKQNHKADREENAKEFKRVKKAAKRAAKLEKAKEAVEEAKRSETTKNIKRAEKYEGEPVWEENSEEFKKARKAAKRAAKLEKALKAAELNRIAKKRNAVEEDEDEKNPKPKKSKKTKRSKNERGEMAYRSEEAEM